MSLSRHISFGVLRYHIPMRKHNFLPGLCTALALGEAGGALTPTCADLWPAVAVAAVFVLLFGYGLAVRGWRLVFVALLGLCLFYRASVAQEHLYREKPWLRHARRHQQAEPYDAGSPLTRLRKDFSRRLGLGLEHAPALASLNRAILLGERANLPRTTRLTFVNAGTIHVFAISGLHVMIVAWLIVYLLLLARLPLRLAGLVSLPVLWGYVVVIGLPPSAVRAALMASFYFLAPLFWRKPDSLVAWELTFLCVHLVRPAHIANVGSVLSFTVMFAILLTVRTVRGILPRRLQHLVVAGAAWAAGVPIAAHVFGRVTPGGLLANLALIPAATVTVVSGALGLLASFVSEKLAAHLNNGAALFTNLMVGISRLVASLPGANFETRPWSFLECALWYAALLAIPLAFNHWRSRRAF